MLKMSWKIILTIPNNAISLFRSLCDWELMLIQGHPTIVSSKIRWKKRHFLGCPEYFSYQEMHSKRRYKNLHLFGHPRGTWVFSKLQGLQYYFAENFRCNLTFYESEDFSVHNILESKNFRFPFSKKNSVSWVVKCEKLNFRKK